MFFDQDHDGNGTYSSFACSAAVTASGVRVDTVYAAGHCMNNGLNGAGFGGGWSTNLQFCPSYINGINPARGCWAWDGYAAVRTPWYTSGSFDTDWGWFRTASTGTVIAQEIVNHHWAASASPGTGAATRRWWNWGYPALPTGRRGTSTAARSCSARPSTATTSTPGRGRLELHGLRFRPRLERWPVDHQPSATTEPRSRSYINSINSWIYLAEEGYEIQGPYADTALHAGLEGVTSGQAPARPLNKRR